MFSVRLEPLLQLSEGSICDLLQGEIYVPYFSVVVSNIHQRRPPLLDRPDDMFSFWKSIKYLPLDVQQSINHFINYCMESCLNFNHARIVRNTTYLIIPWPNICCDIRDNFVVLNVWKKSQIKVCNTQKILWCTSFHKKARNKTKLCFVVPESIISVIYFAVYIHICTSPNPNTPLCTLHSSYLAAITPYFFL